MKKASYLLGLRRRHQYSDERSNRIRAPCRTSFTKRIFHFSGPLGFRRTLNAAERNGRFGGAFSVREVKRAAVEE